MPLKIEEIKLEGTKFDNRAKLTVEQRKAIKVLSEQGFSQRKIATMFNVNNASSTATSKETVKRILEGNQTETSCQKDGTLS